MVYLALVEALLLLDSEIGPVHCENDGDGSCRFVDVYYTHYTYY